MVEFTKPKKEADFKKNFAQIKPLMDVTMSHYESARCLFCYDAPCIKACPTEIDIPLFIRQIHSKHITAAAKTIYNSNYFGYLCGKVCPTEMLCEGACVFNEQGIRPIEIGRLQSYACNHAMQSEISLKEMSPENGKKVAIIGGGPSGLSGACELRSLGYSVDVFEARVNPSGLALHGTAPYKITNKEVLDEVNFLQNQFKFNIHFKSEIDKEQQIKNLEAEYDAILIAIGLGPTRKARVKGEDLRNSYGATEYIESIKLNPFKTHIGKRVIVIGGGNTAMDAASEAARMGAEQVTLLYRRSKQEMGAYGFELDLARSVGVIPKFNTQVSRILGKKKVEAVICVKTKNEDGELVKIHGSEFRLSCDMLIKATGQQKQTHLLDLMGVDYDNEGIIRINTNNYQCSRRMYFAAGDAVNGGKEVVHACAEAIKAAKGIHAYLSSSE